MGNTVLQALFGLAADVRGLRNRPLVRGQTPVIATYHPLAARRRPHLFRLLVEDFARAVPYVGGGTREAAGTTQSVGARPSERGV